MKTTHEIVDNDFDLQKVADLNAKDANGLYITKKKDNPYIKHREVSPSSSCGCNTNYGCNSGSNGDDGFLTSAIFGYVTDNGVLGGVMGGNILGGMVGEMVHDAINP